MTQSTKAVPLFGEIALESVQHIEHFIDAGYRATDVPGLAGQLQQRLNRGSHRISIRGLLFGSDAIDQLETLQKQAISGEEVNFSADIARALDLQKVVVTSFRATERAGTPLRFEYELILSESPELPPPPAPPSFGGLGSFADFAGLDDFGFDLDITNELADLAAKAGSALDQALDVVDQLSALKALTNLDGLGAGPLLKPLSGVSTKLQSLGDSLGQANQLFSDEVSS